ncbi:Tat pathway signal protein [Haloferula helveola]|uniref:Tat pathway signal protein n=1 Tax=Haloferula helveola TaxID=490095 RepID=A0ABM7RD27_9BACT|nr:Tat pathway signal protein [Haloferula helveola]
MKTRRQFLGEASCAAIGSTSVLSTLLNLTMANHASAANGEAAGTRKALVCLFLGGGCDTFNFLIPMDQPGAYDDYAASRSNLAIPRNQLIPLNFTDSLGRSYGVHPSCPRIAEMFNGLDGDTARRRLSFLANVGTLVEPIPDKAAYLSKSVALPKALFSHRDQVEQWQTSVPQGMPVLTGWAGRAADIIHSTLNTEQTGGYYMPMNFSLSGNSTFQIGESEGQFVITSNGALTFTGTGSSTPAHVAKGQAIASTVDSPIEEHYRNLFQRTHGRITSNSIARGQEFQTNFDAPGTVNGIDVNATIAAAGFPNSSLGRNLQAAVRTIAIRDDLKLHRQTIFIEYGGWDHHSELLNTQAGMLANLDQALHAFLTCLETLGLSEDVITFTASDFGRTLRSNGQGTDHAWAGHQMVLGEPVNGGSIFGHYPSVAIDGPDDIGRGGRVFPRLSVDEVFCELLRWFGVSNGDMDLVLPNITNFYDPTSSTNPVGFVA